MLSWLKKASSYLIGAAVALPVVGILFAMWKAERVRRLRAEHAVGILRKRSEVERVTTAERERVHRETQERLAAMHEQFRADAARLRDLETKLHELPDGADVWESVFKVRRGGE